MDDSFTANEVLVAMTKQASRSGKLYLPEDFSEIGCTKVEDLTSKLDSSDEQSNFFNTENYRKILLLTLESNSKRNVLQAVNDLNRRSDVEFAQPNLVTELQEPPVETQSTPLSPTSRAQSNDPNLSAQYGLNKTSAQGAWDYHTGSRNILVGVLDSGIDANHPDLQGNVDMSLSRNFTDDGGDAYDIQGHGTHVAGIIGAIGNNGIGVSGVNWNVTLVSLRVFQLINGELKSYTSSWCQAVLYAINNDIPILNYSGGGYSASQLTESILSMYNGLLVASAGNDSTNTDVNQHYPSGYGSDRIISVASSDNWDNLSSFSNYGSQSVDLAAPGSNILSTYPGGGYQYMSGTSMAAPFVTGTAALMMAINPTLTAEQIRFCILNSTDYVNALSGRTATSGRLNIHRAAELANGEYHMVDGSMVSGDFDGDQKMEIAAFFSWGTYMQLMVWDESENAFDMTKGRIVSFSDNFEGYRFANRVTSGDYNGDNISDIILFFDYGNSNTGIWVFYGGDQNSLQGKRIAYLTDFEASCMTDRIVSGDFDGDEKDEVATFYDYGNSRTGIWCFEKTDSEECHFARRSDLESFEAPRVIGLVTSGDYDGDNKEEIAAFYDYGNYHSALWLFEDVGIQEYSFTKRMDSDAYGAPNIANRITSGDYDRDGKEEIAAFYDYETNSRMALWIFEDNGSTDYACPSVMDLYEWIPSHFQNQVFSGDFDEDGKDEIDVIYNYYRNGKGLWRFSQTNGFFTAWRTWRSIET